MTENDHIDVVYIEKHLPQGHTCQWVKSAVSTQSEVKPNSLLIAENQSAGVGRRGNQWLSRVGRSICLSYRFDLSLPAAQMSGYQITTALAILDTVYEFDSTSKVQLKWPNDLYHAGSKFAGILINLVPRQQSTEVIVGIGINWQLTDEQLEAIDQPVCNLPWSNLTNDNQPTRSQFIAQLTKQINNNNQQFIQHGLSSFLTQWQQHDYLLNQQVSVSGEQLHETGLYQGINAQGELLIQTNQAIKAFCSGEVSVKAV